MKPVLIGRPSLDKEDGLADFLGNLWEEGVEEHGVFRFVIERWLKVFLRRWGGMFWP